MQAIDAAKMSLREIQILDDFERLSFLARANRTCFSTSSWYKGTDVGYKHLLLAVKVTRKSDRL